ncbi:hypothetical protein [Clostridium pasteurianum]|uniref:Uncharacterized protein n=1 Tax=Clostridium pasteurianum BC1 TaxID=86416 RepID=R4JYC9_CLOPA|nr:hypothetical protein [Clostridium pasteurianum]AGK95832.1 hypothetical protein Clopa_0803 [Clostridium pasteurianum BC1]
MEKIWNIYCSCSVHIAQLPDNFEVGIRKAIEITEKEMEFAKLVNGQMAMGMLQILMILEKEFEKQYLF